MLVGGEREKWRAGLGENVHGPATLFFALNSSGDPYNLFSLPSHSQGESVIGITGAVIQMNEVTPTQRAVDSLGISKINASLPRVRCLHRLELAPVGLPPGVRHQRIADVGNRRQSMSRSRPRKSRSIVRGRCLRAAYGFSGAGVSLLIYCIFDFRRCCSGQFLTRRPALQTNQHRSS